MKITYVTVAGDSYKAQYDETVILIHRVGYSDKFCMVNLNEEGFVDKAIINEVQVGQKINLNCKDDISDPHKIIKHYSTLLENSYDEW